MKFVACALAVLLVGCDDSEAIVVLDDAGRDAVVEVAAEDTMPACAPGQTMCAGRCVDVYTDTFNCGNCNVVCASTSICRSGLCVPAAE
jgi:hypothetical protein